jgi:hypothetical protein
MAESIGEEDVIGEVAGTPDTGALSLDVLGVSQEDFDALTPDKKKMFKEVSRTVNEALDAVFGINDSVE